MIESKNNTKRNRDLFGEEDNLDLWREGKGQVKFLSQALRYLDSNKAIEEVMRDFLRISALYLGVNMGFLYKWPEGEIKLELIAAWNGEHNSEAEITGLTSLPNPGIIRGKEISRITVNENNSQVFEDMATVTNTKGQGGNIRQLLALPIEINGNHSLYAIYPMNSDKDCSVNELEAILDGGKIFESILERRIQKNSLASSYASLQQILEHVGCGIIVIDLNRGRTLFSNETLMNMFGINRLTPSTEGLCSELGAILWSRHEASGVIEIYDRERRMYIEVHHSNISWVDGSPVALYAIYDITEKKLYQKKIEQQAYTDFLTGLYNRLSCDLQLERYFSEAREAGLKGSICYVDLNDFKKVNDTMGHQYGDLLLQGIAQRFKNLPGMENNCFRIGGDEFILIIPPDRYIYREDILESIKNVFREPFWLKDVEYYGSMSVGIVDFPEGGSTVSELVRKADARMYKEKKESKKARS